MAKLNIRIILIVFIFGLMGFIVYQQQSNIDPNDAIYEKNGKCYKTKFTGGGKYPNAPKQVEVSCPTK